MILNWPYLRTYANNHTSIEEKLCLLSQSSQNDELSYRAPEQMVSLATLKHLCKHKSGIQYIFKSQPEKDKHNSYDVEIIFNNTCCKDDFRISVCTKIIVSICGLAHTVFNSKVC